MSVLTTATRGEGDTPVVLLHGFLGSGRNLASYARKLTEQKPHLRCILVDLLGHGTSPALPPGADLEDMAQALVSTLDALGVTSPVPIIGHSLGGRVALVTRALAPTRVGTVTLLDIPPGPIHREATDLEFVLDVFLRAPNTTPERAPVRAFFLEQGLSAGLADWLLMNLTPGDGGLVWRIDRQALAAFNARTRGRDLWPMLEGAKTPTASIRGGRARFVSDADLARMQALGVETHTLPGAGHFVHVDALDDLVALTSASL